MSNGKRAALKRLLRKADRKKIGAAVSRQKAKRTPEAKTYRAIVKRSEHVERGKAETLLTGERQKELEARRAAREAREKRRAIEQEIFEESHGEQIRTAKRIGKGALTVGKGAGKVLIGVGELAGRELMKPSIERGENIIDITPPRKGKKKAPLELDFPDLDLEI